jgi:UDP-N-acetylglucosamine diphosphorylase/glucosamine-1-phosphate N-acetyltransferase
MLPVGNKPFMEHVIRALAANDVLELYIVVGYQKEKIMNHFEDGIHYGVKITYIEQKDLLGTAHALSMAKPFIEEDFLVVNGDNFIDQRAIKDLISSEGGNVILAVLRSHTGDYGVLTVEQQKVRKIIEKPGRPCAGILNTGAYKFSPEIFDDLPRTPISERGSYELTQTVSQMIEEGKEIRAEIAKGVWADAIFSWDLLSANSLALSLMKPKISGELEEGARVRGPVEIGEGSIIRSGCYITGPVSIGRNCDIGPNVTILPATSVGESARIGSSSELRNTIVMNGTRIGSGNIFSDSILGASCNLRDQIITETGTAVVDIEDELYKAEFGAILADNVVVGSRVLMNAGTVVGTDSRIGAASSIRGRIERGSRVI